MKTNKIKILPSNVVNQIAAGEVIIRPASIVKELIENSIDANSKTIDIFINNGGKKSILVIDNGIGMSYEDAIISYVRYATSKIKNVDDLFNITTKGFRGEALSSIASIAQLEISTKTTNNEFGTYLRIENNRIKEKYYISRPNGTSILVDNIFFNIPVRRQFLKSDYTEFRHILNEFTKLALAHNDINFRFYNNRHCIYDLKSSSFKTRIINLFGNNSHFIHLDNHNKFIKVTGLIAAPTDLITNKGEQFVFVNKRSVHNLNLYKSIESYFTGVLPLLYGASFFIFIDLPPKYLDINVHPTKSEIRFSKELDIDSVISNCIKGYLRQYQLNKLDNIFIEKNIIKESMVKNSKSVYLKNHFYYNALISEENVLQFMNKYVITYYNGDLLLIDQYRAHQRVLYEYFYNSLILKKDIIAQYIIFPEIINISVNDMNKFKIYRYHYLKLGIKLNFHFKYLYIESIPSGIRRDHIKKIFYDIIKYKIYNDKNELSKMMAKSSYFNEGVLLNHNDRVKLIKDLFSCYNYKRSPFGELIYIKL